MRMSLPLCVLLLFSNNAFAHAGHPFTEIVWTHMLFHGALVGIPGLASYFFARWLIQRKQTR